MPFFPNLGDRAPPVIGTSADGRFYSHDAQAGRPVMLISLGVLAPDAARASVDRLLPFQGALVEAGVDLVALAPFSAAYASAFADDDAARRLVVHINDNSGLESLTVDGAPAVLVLDRGWRIVHAAALEEQTNLVALAAALKPQLMSEPSSARASTAPVLIIPNVLPRNACRALIEHFERSPHRPGMMASARDGQAAAKLDEGKKRRRDIELTAECALHGEIVRVLAQRCAPEIKRAFQFDVAYADRILIARYDDTGGFFKRHRDNAAPQTAFREFAVSINLNTDEYDGGELLFPEFDDHRYSPPAGGAIVFSASLLHEAAPVVRGRRYVALSFLSSAAAQVRMTEAA